MCSNLDIDAVLFIKTKMQKFTRLSQFMSILKIEMK